MAEAQTQPNNSSSNNDTTIPLRRWIEGEEASVRLIAGFGEVNHKYALLLRKTTIAYGITELLRRVRSHPPQAEQLSPAQLLRNIRSHLPHAARASLEEQFSIDNFVVRISGETSSGTTILPSSTPDWNDIKGVDDIKDVEEIKGIDVVEIVDVDIVDDIVIYYFFNRFKIISSGV